MDKQTITIGLTGGIGSGKSTAAKFFEKAGIPIYYADQRAKDLMNNNPQLIKKIKNIFGEKAYQDGNLNRVWIAEKSFSNPETLQQLNQAVHPIVYKDYKQWISQQASPLVMKEAAILVESGSYKNCDEVIVVVADEKRRIERVSKRDRTTQEAIQQRMNNQLSDEERKKFATFIIENNEGIEQLEKQVSKIIVALRTKYHLT
ncbi:MULTISPECIES: dephospho-CoA kinase [Weeksella]|uniref:dephospho-CoA kinase n=1 Tax=Weeksella TaxID=1013 RepID=UPI0008A1BD57|nr:MULTISPECIES: dephospho-CoA kinase [Weeksella]MDK7374381.1 dephospho-CoA kinase [Weeksella virosa]OFM81969.1 dephospho-CoA kinase [Weeksella sp. HMSC059D05]